MIPLPQIIAELVMALGGALLVANAWALMRPASRPGTPGLARPPARGRTIANVLIGLVVFAWGLASFLTNKPG